MPLLETVANLTSVSETDSLCARFQIKKKVLVPQIYFSDNDQDVFSSPAHSLRALSGCTVMVSSKRNPETLLSILIENQTAFSKVTEYFILR